MARTVFVVDIIKDIVSKVSGEITPMLKALDSSIEGVHYLHGHPLEIAQTLSEMSGTNEYRFKKYPCVCLLQDLPEKRGVDEGLYSEAKLHILICKGTEPNYKANQRYEKIFKPYLYPVYDSFLDHMHKSINTFTISSNMIPHTKIDRLFWGVESPNGNTAGIFLDHLDIIEIKDLTLKIKTIYC